MTDGNHTPDPSRNGQHGPGDGGRFPALDPAVIRRVRQAGASGGPANNDDLRQLLDWVEQAQSVLGLIVYIAGRLTGRN